MAAACARVLYVINDLASGGAQRALAAQAIRLDPRRFEVRVASLELAARGAPAEECLAAGLPVVSLRAPREPRPVVVPRLVKLLGAFRPEIVHTHLAAAGVLGRVAARFVGTPRLVTTVHNLSDWEERAGEPLRRLDRATLGGVDAVLAVSDAVARAVARALPAAAARTFTLRNGVELAAFAGVRSARERSRVELGYRPGDFVIGTVARLDRRKGIDVLLEAVGRMGEGSFEGAKSVRLLVVGDGPERAALGALARARGLEDRVTWAGDRPDVRPLLAAMDLLAVPSRSEGLGIALLEGLAAGLPVLGSLAGGIPEILEHDLCGRLVPPGDPGAWARELRAALGDPTRLARWAESAPRAARRFSIESVVCALEDVYDRLLARAGRIPTETIDDRAADADATDAGTIAKAA